MTQLNTNSSSDLKNKIKIPKDIINLENKKEFKYILDGKRMVGYVVKVIDGDTIKVNCEVNGEILLCDVRLLGINAPELKPHNIESDEERKNIVDNAVKAKDVLYDKLFNKLVIIQGYKLDCFGRLLAEVFLPTNINMGINNEYVDTENSENISDYMLLNNLVVKFK